MPDKFIINKSYNKSRLDKWFKEEIINLPNSLIQKLLRKNKIKVNNKRIKSSFRLSEGDNISIFNLSKYKPTDFKKKIQYLPSIKERKSIDNFVIYDDDDYIVINKPRGIAVQSGTNNLKNIVDTLKKTKYFQHTKPFIVHRLDKETSGIFLIAKNRESAQFFTSLFRIRKIHKTYLAIVKGEAPKSLKKMEDFLEYFEKNKKTKLKAITFLKVLKSNSKYSLIELNPKTGRKHQLRKQLYMRGLPIIGDQKYNLKQGKNFKEQPMLLHSFKLKFIKNDKKFSYRADLDSHFQKKLNLYFS
tara:strand:+ start:32 stop:934 length:903 start_codon:yes stop_codon:yes gene_type:complete